MAVTVVLAMTVQESRMFTERERGQNLNVPKVRTVVPDSRTPDGKFFSLSRTDL